MLKIEIQEGENIDRALKRYKRKYRRTKLLEQIKEGQHYVKKSKQRREALQRAEYREKFERENEE
jgi:small subunit ribosomal protein S21